MVNINIFYTSFFSMPNIKKSQRVMSNDLGANLFDVQYIRPNIHSYRCDINYLSILK